MKFIFKRNFQWVLAFGIKILGYIVILNLVISPILWILEILYLSTLILVYEALFTSSIGIFEILCSFIHRENSISYRMGFRTGWWDFKKFAKLTPEERNRHRKEGTIMIMIGFLLGLTAIIVHFSLFTH